MTFKTHLTPEDTSKYFTLLTALEKNLSDVCFVGDPHGHYSHIIDELLLRRAREAIFLGDFFSDKTTRELSLLKSLFAEIQDIGIEVKFINGNHDHHNSETANFFESDINSMNLHGRVATCGICNVTIGGLGGIFFGKIWAPKTSLDAAKGCINRAEALAKTPKNERIHGGLPLKKRYAIYPEEYDTLSQANADVLVCHEAPSYTDKGFRGIDLLAERLGAKLIVHGHLHNDEIALSENSQTAVRSLAKAQVWSIQDDLKTL